MTEADEKAAQLIDKFCLANSRGSFECRPHGQLFARGALELAALSDHWPKLRSSMEELIGQPEFLNPRISMTTSILERNLHGLLIVALQELAIGHKTPATPDGLNQIVSRWRSGSKPDTMRLACWDALHFIKSSKPQN
jgi:hypothetical protein